ncbi:TPA: Csa1 family protein, partial [Staphylococcus aureus]
SSVGYKDIEFTFVEKKEENIYFSDSLDYKKKRRCIIMAQSEYEINPGKRE